MDSMGLAAHDHRTVQGHLPKVLEIGFQPPRQLTFTTNDRILANRCNQHDLHGSVPVAKRISGTGVQRLKRLAASRGKSQTKFFKKHGMIRRSVITA